MAKEQSKKMGLWMLTALVAGNMIGSGIFLLPANLASVGSISLISWGFTSVGAFLLACVFAKMSVLTPRTGGPYAYAEAGFGKFIGFQTGYNYWIAIWVGNAAIAIAAAGYMADYFPILHKPFLGCATAIFLVWFFTFINMFGVRSAGTIQIITTIFKLIPIILIGGFGWWYFHPEYLSKSFNITHHSNFSAISQAATLTLWAFIGLESATVPSDSVDNPSRNIPLATFLGMGIATIAYIASSTAIMGMIPDTVLAKSTAPFSAAAAIIFGQWGKWFVTAGAIISCLGALNGWTLLQGQIPMAAAEDGLFPAVFAKRNKANVPSLALIVTSILVTMFLLLTISKDLIQQYKIIILIASLTSLIPYLYTAIAEIIILADQHPREPKIFYHVVIALLAATYSFWAIFGSGEYIVYYGSMLIFTSIPIYALVYWQQAKKDQTIDTKKQ